jgi:NAD(P) transhydrogenase subunit alpha
MRHGAVIVDLAADTGGNVEGTVPGEVAETEGGVRIIGTRCMEGTGARDASGRLASNLFALIEHFFAKESGGFDYREEDEILKGCLIVRNGAIVHEKHLIIPYAMSDYATTFATIAIEELLASMS